MLKASMNPETIEDIQKLFNNYQKNDINERNVHKSDTRMRKEQCLQQHLSNIVIINTRSAADFLVCRQFFSNVTETLHITAQIAKEENDLLTVDISHQILYCKSIEDVEMALQCHIDLKFHFEAIANVSNSAKKTLDELSKKKGKAKSEEAECIHLIIIRANLEIDAEHTKLLQC